MNKFTFFIKWILQRESNPNPRQMQFIAVIMMATAVFLSKLIPSALVLLYLGLGLYLYSYIMEQWQEYRRRKAYEDWKKGHQPKKTEHPPETILI